jgi:pimeloyl-ACP methyl ester carboxylesterase
VAEFTTRDGTQIFYKDWGAGHPIVFSHGWPLSSDDWDAQMLFFLHHGYRVIAHDRRGHGRSAQPSEGNDMDHYADDLADLTQHLDLHDAVHVGHSAGGGEVFYNFDQPGVETSEAIIANWWRQGMMGGAKGQYDCVTAFIREDYTDDLKKITVPVLVMNGDGDQIVPYATSGPRAVGLVQNGTLKTYPGFPHGMPTTHADTINHDLLSFIQS